MATKSNSPTDPPRVAYRVLLPLQYGTTADDQRRFEPGETVEMLEAVATQAVAAGALAPISIDPPASDSDSPAPQPDDSGV